MGVGEKMRIKEYYTAFKKKEILPLATARMQREGIMLSETSQSKQDKHHVIPVLYLR